ncbi:MAG: hypothetical protein KC503_13655 [Myxococcales bacterium]|nr:hypothetical protein [Myxococcales bacterium]
MPLELEEAIERYKQELTSRGNRSHSIDKTISRLGYLLGECPLEQLDLQEMYDRRREVVAADSHRRELSEAKSFLRWCVSKGWLPKAALAEINKVKPKGKKRAGPASKPQLRIDEARLWMDEALRLARAGNEGGLGPLLTLLLALRKGEVQGLRRRDVDDNGRLLWVDGTKSENARRTIEVPDVLRPLLCEQAERVEGPSLWIHTGTNWIYNWTRRICERAGVPSVCPQSMRGLQSSLARGAGVTGHAVAAQLGHGSVEMHEQAYADPAAVEAGQRQVALKVLQGGK